MCCVLKLTSIAWAPVRAIVIIEQWSSGAVEQIEWDRVRLDVTTRYCHAAAL